MKAKTVSLMVLVLHIAVLGGFSLMQGCTTGTSPIPWLNWPYTAPREEPPAFPTDDIFAPLPPPLPAPDRPDYEVRPYEDTAYDAGQVYVVQKGDTLSSIASRYGTTWRALADFNHLSDPNRLRVGQEIRIPSSFAPSAPSQQPSAPPSGAARPSGSISRGTSYVIQRGDTLSGIAQRSGVTVAELKAANLLAGDRIIAGQSLTIPEKGGVSASAPAAPERTEPAAAPAPSVTPAPATRETAPPVAAAPVYEHVLYPGETLEEVARQYSSSQSEIMKLNNITDPAAIRPGTKLLIPIPD